MREMEAIRAVVSVGVSIIVLAAIWGAFFGAGVSWVIDIAAQFIVWAVIGITLTFFVLKVFEPMF